MQKRDVPYLVFGLLITAISACRPPNDDNTLTSLEPAWPATSSATARDAIEPEPAALPAEPTAEPPRPPPLPGGDEWPALGGPRAGLSLAIPPTWVNLTDQINIPAMNNRLGINLVFAAESESVGRSLLAGKSFANGAYVSGLLVTPPAAADPAAALVELLATAAPSAVRLTPVTPFTTDTGATGLVVDVADGPVGLNVADPNDLRTRVALFMPPEADDDAGSSGIVVLLSASASRWERLAPQFHRMLQSATLYEMRPGVVAQEGNVMVRGGLEGDRVQAGATLERDVHDLWTFTTAGSRYASLFLQPEEPHLDLSLTLLGPDRQAVAQVDNGFAGMIESAADLLLAGPGGYIIEVSDFNGDTGRYNLALTLSDQPQYAGGGQITFGQALQANLSPNGQHYWIFTGVAGQRISIVMEPGETTFDPILELIGPNDRQLVVLDEGFSGDPELISDLELPVAGEYAILVRSFSPLGGSYSISLDEGDRPVENIYDAGDLAYGSVRAETLQRQEAHAWFLPGKAGDHILIRVTPLSTQLDLDVWLLDEQIERVAAVDEFAAGEPETIELTLVADGQYVVMVRDFNGESGEYEIVLGAAPAATPELAGSLSYGDAVISAIPAGMAVGWTFIAQAGDIIDIDAQAGDASGDLVLSLLGPDGLSVVAADDNSAGGDEAIHAFTVPSDGQWQIVLSEFFGSMASYRLRLERAER